MSKRGRKPSVTVTAPPTKRVSRRYVFAAGVAALLMVGATLVLFSRQTPGKNPLSATPTLYRTGNVEYCANASAFALAMGFAKGGALDTRPNFVRGVALRELDYEGNIVRNYEHPSWSKAGYMGSYQRDQAGNIYLIPMPFISVLDNPPEKANTIYRIDTNTGAMSPMVKLPSFGPPTPENIYGLMDITYDCDTHSLYVSSISGSTYQNVVGCIFRVDPYTKAIKSTLEGVDAFGIGVFNTPEGKRLYFGLARAPEIYSVALAENGDFVGDIRPEISLAGLGFHGDERARSIAFVGDNGVSIRTMKFDFNLVAPTETRQTLLNYAYDSAQNSWQLVESQAVNG